MWRNILVGVVLAGLVAGCSLGDGSRGLNKGTVSGLVVVEGGKDPMFGGSDINPVKAALVLGHRYGLVRSEGRETSDV